MNKVMTPVISSRDLGHTTIQALKNPAIADGVRIALRIDVCLSQNCGVSEEEINPIVITSLVCISPASAKSNLHAAWIESIRDSRSLKVLAFVKRMAKALSY